MATVKILKRSKKISIRLSFSTMFAMRMAVGNYLYENPEDKEMAEFYGTLPEPEEYRRTWRYTPGHYIPAGQRNIRFDVMHLDCLIRALKLVAGGAWPQADSIMNRVEVLEQISPLEALGMAAGGG